ncbi:MAG: hypothetical protein KGJ86_20605 [Chloroflexota bacterium]|nr:hypothetical protein [Chloroflexota bacterium]
MAALTYARGQLASAGPGSTGQPATGQPATGQPGTGQPGAGQPGSGQRPGAGQAQFEQPNGPGALFVLKDGKPVRTPVQFGISDGKFVQVISGVAEGDLVVTGEGTTDQGTQAVPSTQGSTGAQGTGMLPVVPK